jgi:acyl-CoA hydrolase
MLSFLKKAGQILAKGTQIILGFGPLVSSLVPQVAGTVAVVSKSLSEIAAIVVQVEAMGVALGLSGAEKLEAATAAAVNIVLQSSMMVGRTIANPVLFREGVKGIVDGVVKVLNSLKDEIDTKDVT